MHPTPPETPRRLRAMVTPILWCHHQHIGQPSATALPRSAHSLSLLIYTSPYHLSRHIGRNHQLFRLYGAFREIYRLHRTAQPHPTSLWQHLLVALLFQLNRYPAKTSSLPIENDVTILSLKSRQFILKTIILLNNLKYR